ncbi:hypothetical protein BDZ97DRAFT_1756616 [Flammula alnicola]|nr:hypothetical protein BDZ97DRAFT_1756616 [Flammula alnicola]
MHSQPRNEILLNQYSPPPPRSPQASTSTSSIFRDLPTRTHLPNLGIPSKTGVGEDGSLELAHDHDDVQDLPQFKRQKTFAGSSTTTLTGKQGSTESALRPKIDARQHSFPRDNSNPAIAPASNEGIPELERALNISFSVEGPSGTRRSRSSSADALSSMNPVRKATLDHYWNSGAKKNDSISSTTRRRGLHARHLNANFPSSRTVDVSQHQRDAVEAIANPAFHSVPFPEPISTSSSSTSAVQKTGNTQTRERHPRYGKTQLDLPRTWHHKFGQPTSYEADLDELEMWTKASVSPAVFGKATYLKKRPERRADAEARMNLRMLRSSIERRTGKNKAGTGQGISPAANDPRSVAVSVVSRSVLSELIIAGIFGPEDKTVSLLVFSVLKSDTHRDSQDASSDNRLSTGPSRKSSNSDLLAANVVEHASAHIGHERVPLPDTFAKSSFPLASQTRESSADALDILSSVQTAEPTENPFSEATPKHNATRSLPSRRPTIIDLKDDDLPVALNSAKPSPSQCGPSPDLSGNSFFDLVSHTDYEPSHSPTVGPRLSYSGSPIPEAIPIVSADSQASQFSMNKSPLPSAFESEIHEIHGISNHPPAHASHTLLREMSEEVVELVSPMVLEQQNAPSPPPPSADAAAFMFYDPTYPSPPPSSVNEPELPSVSVGDVPSSGSQSSAEASVDPDFQTDDMVVDENEFVEFGSPQAGVKDGAPGPRPVSPGLPALPIAIEPPSPESRSSPLATAFTKPSLQPARDSTATSAIPSTWTDVDFSMSSETPSSPQRSSIPTIFDPGYLQPRYRDLWAKDQNNTYLERAKEAMVIGEIRADMKVWYEDEELDEEQDTDEEDEELDELDDDSEDGVMDVEIEDAKSHIVFLAVDEDVVAETPTQSRNTKRKRSFVQSEVAQKDDKRRTTRSSGKDAGSRGLVEGDAEGIQFPETPSTRRRTRRRDSNSAHAEAPQNSGDPEESMEDSQSAEKEAQEDDDDLIDPPKGLADEVQRWTAALWSLVKGKKKVEYQDLLDLKKALQDIHTNAAHIKHTSSLADAVYTVANLQIRDVPDKDEMGLRALARKSVRAWGIRKQRGT